MGLFSKTTNKPNEEEKKILITTTEDIPGRKYKVIGVVHAGTVTLKRDLSPILEEIQKKAAKLSADAIVGFRATTFMNKTNWIEQFAYGTAIRFLKEGEE